MPDVRYEAPRSIDQALSLLHADPGAAILAGGTDHLLHRGPARRGAHEAVEVAEPARFQAAELEVDLAGGQDRELPVAPAQLLQGAGALALDRPPAQSAEHCPRQHDEREHDERRARPAPAQPGSGTAGRSARFAGPRDRRNRNPHKFR